MPRGVDRYDEARHQGRLWTPDSADSFVQLDASDHRTLSFATGVSAWRNKGLLGSTADVVQATTGRQPTWNTKRINGRPALGFTAGSSNRLATSASSGIFTNAAAIDVYVVLRSTHSGTSGGQVYEIGPAGGVSAAGGGVGCYLNDGVANTIEYASHMGASGYAFVKPVAAFSTNAVALFGVFHDTTIATNEGVLYRNGAVDPLGTPTTSGTVSGTLPFAAGLLSVGSRVSNVPASMDLGEIVITAPGTPDVRDRWHGYLAWKWGLPLAGVSPYANRPPLIGD